MMNVYLEMNWEVDICATCVSRGLEYKNLDEQDVFYLDNAE